MRRIRTFGLLALLTMALTATVGAATASASGFVAHNYKSEKNEYPVVMHAASIEPMFLDLGNGTTVQCGGSSDLYEEMQGSMRVLSAQLTDQSECELRVFGILMWEAPGFDSNNCHLIFHPGAETSTDWFEGTYDIGGPSCKVGLQLDATNINCTLTFPPQAGQPATFHNVGEGNNSAVEIAQVDNDTLEYTAEGSGGLSGCPKEGLHTNAGWSANREAVAHNEAAARIGFSLDPEAPLGVYVEGGEFKGESYPISVGGDQGEKVEFSYRYKTEPPTTTSCASAHFVTLLESASSLLSPVTAAFGNCTASLFGESRTATVAMNSCSYAFHGDGTMDVACSKGGDAVKITIPSTGCVVSIGAQTGLKGVTYSTVGSGHDRAIEIDMNVEGVSYTTSAGLLACAATKGSHADGVYSGSILLNGGVE